MIDPKQKEKDRVPDSTILWSLVAGALVIWVGLYFWPKSALIEDFRTFERSLVSTHTSADADKVLRNYVEEGMKKSDVEELIYESGFSKLATIDHENSNAYDILYSYTDIDFIPITSTVFRVWVMYENDVATDVEAVLIWTTFGK